MSETSANGLLASDMLANGLLASVMLANVMLASIMLASVMLASIFHMKQSYTVHLFSRCTQRLGSLHNERHEQTTATRGFVNA